MGLLEKIDDPKDLRRLPVEDLPRLAEEIRHYILEVVRETGGHLGSPLGAVEIAIALHYVFATPRDRIVWDVGHQAYAHKILTGRREAMRGLRQQGGPAGFLKRSESEHDAFGAGHASTSISAALGFAVARDRRGSNERVVAVIGDGSMTGGLAFEGLNNAGALKTDLLVVLNDNSMSISPNVGALSTYFTRLVTTPVYARLKEDVETLIGEIPAVGGIALDLTKRLEHGFKDMLIPRLIFEELGFRYLGPIDGHDLATLVPLLERLRRQRGPVLLHVRTEKGKGFPWIEEHPEKAHGAAAGFCPETGRMPRKPAPPSYTKVFAEALLAEMERDPRVVAITAAMPSGTGLDLVAARFPDRVFDVGIAEGHAVTFAAGLAADGFRPVVAVYSTFLQRAYDQIVHDVATQRLPVVFAMDRGGIVGDDGETHQGLFDLAFLRPVPHMVLLAPRDENEMRHALATALAHDGPAAFRYPRDPGIGLDLEAPRVLPHGVGEVLHEGGAAPDAALLGWGHLLSEALSAAALLEKEGISLAVADMRWVKPLDRDLVRRFARRCGRIVTLEEGVLAGGAGAAVLEALAEEGLSARVERLGVPDVFVPHGKAAVMRERFGLTAPGIAEAVRRLLGRATNVGVVA